MLEVLANVRGRFLLSGYRSEMYDEYADRHGWHCAEFETDNKAASGPRKRRVVECVWANYDPKAATRRARLLSL